MTDTEVMLKLSDCSGDDDPEFPWPFVLVPAFLNGHGPFSFGLELGRGRTMLTEAVVRAIGVNPADIPEVLTLKGEGCSLDFPLVKLNSLSVGTAELKEFDAMVWGNYKIRPASREVTGQAKEAPVTFTRPSTEEETAALQPDWNGIIGFDFLKHFRVTFDFPAGKLRLQRS